MSGPLIGTNGPEVIVSGRAAYLLLRLTRSAMQAARDDGWLADDELADTVGALRMAANHYANERLRSERSGTHGIPTEDEAGIVRVEMSTTETAEALGCTKRNVTALAARGTLHGRRLGRRWLIDAASVADYRDDQESA